MIKSILVLGCSILTIMHTSEQLLMPDSWLLSEAIRHLVSQRVPSTHLSDEMQQRIAPIEASYLADIHHKNRARADQVARIAQKFPQSLAELPDFVASVEQQEGFSKTSLQKKCCRSLGSTGCNPSTLVACLACFPQLEELISGCFLIATEHSAYRAAPVMAITRNADYTTLIDLGRTLCCSATSKSCIYATYACLVCREYTTDWYTWLVQADVPAPIIRREFLAELAAQTDELVPDDQEI
jgi:hypothetical protein